MDVILALGAEIRKMFAGDAILSLAAVVLVAIIGVLVRTGELDPDLAPWLLMIGVAFALVIAINIALFKSIRKTRP
ncbi:MAG TPA: hypothetical protein VG227_03895 [Caulobacteraceae bacterium]|nr:hypothetical protein [Caulobacteraceae bacterium]